MNNKVILNSAQCGAACLPPCKPRSDLFDWDESASIFWLYSTRGLIDISFKISAQALLHCPNEVNILKLNSSMHFDVPNSTSSCCYRKKTIISKLGEKQITHSRHIVQIWSARIILLSELSQNEGGSRMHLKKRFLLRME